MLLFFITPIPAGETLHQLCKTFAYPHCDKALVPVLADRRPLQYAVLRDQHRYALLLLLEHALPEVSQQRSERLLSAGGERGPADVLAHFRQEDFLQGLEAAAEQDVGICMGVGRFWGGRRFVYRGYLIFGLFRGRRSCSFMGRKSSGSGAVIEEI